MCLGIPMQVLENDGTSALCEGRGERRRVSTLLLGDAPPGSWVLVHVDAAIRVIDAEEAALVGDALSALEAAVAGRPTDGFFADLEAREPTLPEHLRPRSS